MSIRIGILGYGNLGKGVELAVQKNDDMELVALFTRRDPESITTITGVPVYAAADMAQYTDAIDVLILCGGSATDLPKQTPEAAKLFNVVDSLIPMQIFLPTLLKLMLQLRKAAKLA